MPMPRRSACCATSCPTSSDGSGFARKTRPGRPALIPWPTGSPTAEGRPPAGDEAPEDRTPVMVRLGAVDLATLDTLDCRRRREQPGRGLALGLEPPPRTPGLRPAPAAGTPER